MADIMGMKQLDNEAIARLFCDYVCKMQDKPRHTVKAELEVGIYEQFCAGAFPHNIRLQNGLYDKMMNVAVEYEESGFIAGFRYAMALLSSQEQTSEEPEQILAPEAEQTVQEAVKGSQGQVQMIDNIGNYCITTKQIAEMFETTNFKVVSRIEQQILPYLDQESKRFFCKVEGVNVQHKPVTFYKLNRAACQLYLKAMEPKRKKFVNIAGGYAKLQELMEMVFPSDIRAVMA